MLDAYKNGEDIHSITTSAVFGISREEAADKHQMCIRDSSIPGEKGDFCFFINYTLEGSLYNYVVWVH